MNELASIVALAEQSASEPLALATVVNVSGSAYRRPGARMLITASGQTAGMISGGCLEGDVRERAQQALAKQHSLLVTYDSTASEDIIFGLGLGCNGIVQVMIEPLSRDDPDGLLAFLNACQRERKPGRIASVFALHPAQEPRGEGCTSSSATGEPTITSFKNLDRVLHWPNGRITSSVRRPLLRQAIDEALHEHAKRRVKHSTSVLAGGDTAEWLIETIVPPPSLYLFGAGDDVIPVAALAQQLGWHVTITDARAAFANHSRFPNANVVQCQRPESFDTSNLEQAIVLVMTHSYLQDKEWLRRLLPLPLLHLSQIGPKNRTARLLEELRAEGLPLGEADLKKLHAPAGLDIGAETPVEVALSLVSGMFCSLTHHHGGLLSERDGPIHEPLE